MSDIATNPSATPRIRRPRPKVMTLTDRAAERVKSVMAAKGPDIVALRVGIKKGGCAGMEYTMEWADKVLPFDEVVEDKDVKVLVDGKALMYLLGTVMDFEASKLSAGFTFKNPNETSACGCGESVAIAPRKAEDLAEVS